MFLFDLLAACKLGREFGIFIWGEILALLFGIKDENFCVHLRTSLLSFNKIKMEYFLINSLFIWMSKIETVLWSASMCGIHKTYKL
jgi:hypothetical protein